MSVKLFHLVRMAFRQHLLILLVFRVALFRKVNHSFYLEFQFLLKSGSCPVSVYIRDLCLLANGFR